MENQNSSQEELVEIGPKGRPVRSGIQPLLLIEQVKNTAPFLFEEGSADLTAPFPYVQFILNMEREMGEGATYSAEESESYFDLCWSAHYCTVATFVPTDVDNQIRFRIWNRANPTPVLEAMANRVLGSIGWDSRLVSTRTVAEAEGEGYLSGHHGEWFSVAVAAYAATRKRLPEHAEKITQEILGEVQRELELLGGLKKKRDGIGAMKAATLIAHNFGDLLRVMDQWELKDEDTLRAAVTKMWLGELSGLNHEAAELNRIHMAADNHRHYPLRAARCLRTRREFLLPIGPFFDDWGKVIGASPYLTPEEIASVAQALVDGWTRLTAPVGYARALSGIVEKFPGGFGELKNYLPSRTAKAIQAGPLHTQMVIPQSRFEGQWNQAALKFLNLRSN